MSQQIDTALVKQYHDNIERLLQQRGSRLRNAVRVENQKGEEAFWEQVGSVAASPVLTRHGDSPLVNTPHARRRVTLVQYDVGDMIDDFDKVKMLADPTSVYVQNFVDALGRAMDDEIISAFSGTAYTGKAGGTSVTSGWGVINEDFGTGDNTGMTIEKLVGARQLMLEAHNEPNTEPWYIVMAAEQLANLLNTTQATNADYNTVRALVRGELDTFLGFKFITSERLATGTGGGGAADCRRCFAWAKSGMLLSVAKDITTEVARRADKRFSWYAYACASFGATRMQEGKIVEIQCVEA
jgi:hypothetical protein